ncbi:hypothetical protein EZJ19_15295 [Parasulfuritortus cantonensis]|uniref:Uncharacterized protein n=1 Tax=Parasulfuritortus cantonensis TaxID=2528202 RepID=A0A4R1B7E6_9PROT|nr:DUF6156 family protein [Parasulfuritortus cantonensis]TCJ11519.1 hypothetical protein EZJ19_15295 [Parasulfuritortus cantonensis]
MSAGPDCRYFLSYAGVGLPFKLITPLGEDQVANRNTYIKGYFDTGGSLLGFDKLVYGEVELAHRYEYAADGRLRRAEIIDIDGESTVLEYPAG